MTTNLARSAAALVALLCTTGALAAQAPTLPPADTATPSPSQSPAADRLVTGFREELLRHLAELEEKILGLARATPVEAFAWRPAAGVRSVGEVYAHIAATNVLVPQAWGAAPAEGVDPRAIQQTVPPKDELIAALKTSFDYLRKETERTSVVELERPIVLFGRQTTVRDGFVTVTAHMHEHLGQSIAYARVNGIVPPWSEEPSAVGAR